MARKVNTQGEAQTGRRDRSGGASHRVNVRGSGAGSTRSNMSKLDRETNFGARIQAEREQLFKAIDIVECCKCASATLIEADPSEYMSGVFDVLSDLLNTAAGELGCIADECRCQR